VQSYMVEKHREKYYISKNVGVGKKTIFKLTFKKFWRRTGKRAGLLESRTVWKMPSLD